jgi:prepilin-type processing-associated H-X9-DG protein
MRQIGTATAMYVQDANSAYPTMNYYAAQAIGDPYGEAYNGHWAPNNYNASGGINYEKTASLFVQLNPYIKNANVWACPSDPSVDTTMTNPADRWTSYHYRLFMNVNIAPGYDNNPNGSAYLDSTFPYPAQTYIYCEVTCFHDVRTGWPWPSGTNAQYPPDDKMVFAFADGHVAAMPVDKVILKANEGVWVYDYHWPKDWTSYIDYQ